MRRLRRPRRRNACPGVRMMRRRDVISLLGGAAAANSLAAFPFAARAQANKIRNVAWLGVGGPDQPSPYLESFRAGLRELGWVEGRNLKIGTFWATGLDDMAAATQQALASDPEIVVTQEFMAIAMLLSKAPKPVVFGFSGDPVGAKLAQSWARPGGNFTGMSYLAVELVGKRVELLEGMAARHQAHRGAGAAAAPRRGYRARGRPRRS